MTGVNVSPQWRMTLDAPSQIATEVGHIRTAHCADFRANDGDATPVNTFRDPLTGIVLLTPSVIGPGFATDFEPLTSWTVQQAWWATNKRAVDSMGNSASLLGTVKPAGQSPSLITLLSETAIIAIINQGQGDTLVWAAHSKFTLGADQGFAIHYHGLNDEMLRMHNWFCIQWGGILVHLDSNGVIRTYAYPNGDNTQTPVLFDEFNLSSPGEMYNRPGYFWFLPIPGIGLCVYHSLTSQFLGTQTSNAGAGALRGRLVKLPATLQGSGAYGMLAASNVLLGLNPNLDHILGFQHMTFPGTGTYTDDVFDPGYLPSSAPQISTIALPTLQQGVSGTLRKADNSGNWAVGDQPGRLQLNLATSDPHYTPFAYGYQVQWPAVLAPRAPTPLVLGWQSAGAADRMTRLEFSEDEYLRFEGSVSLILGSTHGRQLAERGDATFLLEKSFDGGATWITHAGGLAAQSPGARLVIMGGRCWYEATWTLADFWARVDEVHETKPFACDGLTIGNALNAALATSGFAPIQNLPPAANTTLLQRVGGDQQYQFAPRVGDSGSKILTMFLLFLRRRDPVTQLYVEYRLRYDWPTQTWILENKPLDLTNAWTLTPWSNEEHVAGNVIRFETLELTVLPPEENKMVAKGVNGTSANEAEIVTSAPVINFPSLSDPTSVDYKGRLVTAEYHVLSLSDQGEVDKMALRIFEASAHRRLQPKTTTPYWVDGLGPLAYMTVRAILPGGARGAIYTSLWVKRRSLSVDQSGIQTMTLEMDDQWLGELEA